MGTLRITVFCGILEHMSDNDVSRETNPPKYVVIGHDERGEIRRYNDGSLRNEKGHALSKIPNDGHEITRENAREYHAMRKRKILDAIERKLTDVTHTNAPAEEI